MVDRNMTIFGIPSAATIGVILQMIRVMQAEVNQVDLPSAETHDTRKLHELIAKLRQQIAILGAGFENVFECIDFLIRVQNPARTCALFANSVITGPESLLEPVPRVSDLCVPVNFPETMTDLLSKDLDELKLLCRFYSVPSEGTLANLRRRFCLACHIPVTILLQ